MQNLEKWLLIDGMNIAFRSFYAIPNLQRSDGFPTNVIYGFLKTLWFLLDAEQPRHVRVFFDLGRCQRKMQLLPSYKQNRKETPENLRLQLPLIKQLLPLIGIPVIEEPATEADDLIASAVAILHPTAQVLIASADKDMAQCLVHANVTQILPPSTTQAKSQWTHLNASKVFEKLQVHADQMIDYLALIGDTSDNIDGIPGIGPKTAVSWLQAYPHIQDILANVQYIKPERFQAILQNHADLLQRNIELIRLNSALALPELFTELSLQASKAMEMLASLEMKSLMKNFEQRYLQGTLL